MRAYTDAAKEVLAVLPRAEKIPTHTVMVAFPYTYFERVRQLVARHAGQLLDEDFAADVTITARFMLERFPLFQSDLSELTRGEIQAEIIETNPDTIFPLDSFPRE